MEDRPVMNLALSSGETRQILLEAGSTVLVLAGQLAVRRPMLWLAENMVAPEVFLGAEQAWVVETGGWTDLQAKGCATVIIVPPDGVSLWRQVGRCLDALFGMGKEMTPASRAEPEQGR